MLCDRGVSFGYNTLISDMRGLAQMREFGKPIVFDATHSVQQPGGLGGKSGGDRTMVPVLARSAIAAGISGIFMETHPEPEKALSDGANMLPIAKIPELLKTLKNLDEVVKNGEFLEDKI
jgi:2-dehydro-3-deoxyphosphooctonate aldolase (KDO 8-P synthase)